MSANSVEPNRGMEDVLVLPAVDAAVLKWRDPESATRAPIAPGQKTSMPSDFRAGEDVGASSSPQYRNIKGQIRMQTTT